MQIKIFIKEHDIVCKISQLKNFLKQEFFGKKLKQCIGKPKDLWKAIKSLGLPNKVLTLPENKIVKHDTKSILKTLKSFYSKLRKSPNRYAVKFVSDYYEKLSLSENFKLDSITEDYLFNILKNLEITKAVGIDQI